MSLAALAAKAFCCAPNCLARCASRDHGRRRRHAFLLYRFIRIKMLTCPDAAFTFTPVIHQDRHRDRPDDAGATTADASRRKGANSYGDFGPPEDGSHAPGVVAGTAIRSSRSSAEVRWNFSSAEFDHEPHRIPFLQRAGQLLRALRGGAKKNGVRVP